MNQFLIPKNTLLTSGEVIELSPEEAHHLRDVQRRKENETIQVTNGQKSFYAQIVSITKNEVTVRLMNEITINKNGSLEIAQSLLKGDTIEWVLEKSVELGVDKIQLLTTSRTISEESPNKRVRWEKIIDAAVKQCGTPSRPTLASTTSLENFIKNSSQDSQAVKIIFFENGGASLKEVLKNNQNTAPHVTALIGPEGGFSEAEVSLAKAHGFIPVFLGQRILRAETAAIVAASLIQYELGNL